MKKSLSLFLLLFCAYGAYAQMINDSIVQVCAYWGRIWQAAVHAIGSVRFHALYSAVFPLHRHGSSHWQGNRCEMGLVLGVLSNRHCLVDKFPGVPDW